MPRKPMPLMMRIDERTHKTNDPDQCWLWVGGVSSSGGAPVISVDHTCKSVRKIVYEATCGPTPPDHYIAMTCQHTLCLNPRHMLAVKHGARYDATIEKICFSGKALKRERQRRNITQRHLAERVGVTTDVVRRWEKDSEPNATHLLRILALFGVSNSPMKLASYHESGAKRGG